MSQTAGLFEVGGPENSYQTSKGMFEKLQRQGDNSAHSSSFNPYVKEMRESMSKEPRQPYDQI